MNWRREWSILHMVDKLLVLLRLQCWAVYSGEETVRKIAVWARVRRALFIATGSPPVGMGMALTAPSTSLRSVDDIWPPNSSRFMRSISASGLAARAVSVVSGK